MNSSQCQYHSREITINTVVSSISDLTDKAVDAGNQVMSAGPSAAEGDEVLLTWGYDYYKMGRITGELIHEVF